MEIGYSYTSSTLKTIFPMYDSRCKVIFHLRMINTEGAIYNQYMISVVVADKRFLPAFCLIQIKMSMKFSCVSVAKYSLETRVSSAISCDSFAQRIGCYFSTGSTGNTVEKV